MGTETVKTVDLDQQVNFLKRIYFFNDFDDHELRQFLALSKWMIFSGNTLVIEENSVGKGFFILVHGEVSVFKTLPEDNSTVLLTTLTDGDCFGEMSLVSETRRTAGIITTRNSFILMVDQEIISKSNVFLQLKFYKRFCEILVNRLIRANERVVSQVVVPQPLKALQQGLKTVRREPAISERLKEVLSGKSKTGSVQTASPGRGEQVAPKSGPETAGQSEIPDLPERRDGEKLAALSLRKKLMPELYLSINPVVGDRLAGFFIGEIHDTRGFAEIILQDPSLSAAVLQCANSSFFRRATAVATVPHAMITVGIKQIQELLAGVVERSKSIALFSGNRETARKFWQHSVAVGRIAEMLKDAIRITTPADIYLAGLLHDTGMLALDKLGPGFYARLEQQHILMVDLIEAEKDHIGADHGQIGHWLLEKMGLPQLFQDVARFHHAPENARDHHLAVALVHLADLFAVNKGTCVGAQEDTNDALQRSFAWVLIQEQSRAFMDVNIAEFIEAMKAEIDKTWSDIIADAS